MGGIARGAARHRLFTPEFKKEQISRVLRGEVALSAPTGELDVSPSVVRKWKRLVEHGADRVFSRRYSRG